MLQLDNRTTLGRNGVAPDRSWDTRASYAYCCVFRWFCTRHIDRKLFKLREMRGAGIVKVQYIPTDENTADLFTKVLKRQPFEKHRKVVLNTGAGESTDEVKQQRVAALSAWKTKRVFHTKPQATSCKQTSHLCLRGERAWGETLD